jgi:hypothetical protein
MKYIVNTGCSYGVMFRSMFRFTNGSDVEFRVIDLHCDSHGSEYQKRSIILTVNELIKKGVDSNDIYVITEWSQPNRLFVEIPQEFVGDILENEDYTEPNFVLDNSFKKINDTNLEFIGKYKSLNIVIQDRVYANIEHSDLESFDNPNAKFYIKEFVKNCPISYKPIDRLEQYLTNILDLQSFLKSKDINYTFFLMNNTFEGYYDNFSNFSYTEDTLKLVQKEKIELPNLEDFIHIKEFSYYLNNIWESLDLSDFVFYKTDRFNYGGIDEYTMETFGHEAYTAGANTWDIPDDGYCTCFGAHPHDSVYVSFFEKYIYPRFKHIFGEMKFDYTDRWSRTKHNAIREYEK